MGMLANANPKGKPPQGGRPVLMATGILWLHSSPVVLLLFTVVFLDLKSLLNGRCLINI